MSLGAPLALLGLLALPLIWWLHKKLRRPPEVVLPSLMFLQDEDDASKLPSGRRFDAELLLALAAAALLALAAAEPVLVQAPPRRVVRVVVSGGGPALMSGYPAAARAARDRIRATLEDHDEMQVRWVPRVDSTVAPRPTDERLLAEAMAGQASARFVISDRAPSVELGPVRWIAVGEPDRSNTGIVSVSVHPTDAGPELFCTIAHHGPDAVRGTVELHADNVLVQWEAQPMAIAPDGVATFRFPLKFARGAPLTLGLANPQGDLHDDALLADDDVFLTQRALVVHIAAGLPEALRERIELALGASVGPRGYRLVKGGTSDRLDLAFSVRGAAPHKPGPGTWLMLFEPVAEGAAAERAPSGTDGLGRDPLVEDLSTASVGWVYAPGATAPVEGERVLLARQAGGRTWPVVLAQGRVVRFAPDPTRGEPRALDAPLWPLLIDNLVAAAVGRGIGLGYRAVGLLDAASSRPGRVRIPLDVAALRATQPSVVGRARPLRPLLVACALACLALLWAAPRIRRRWTPKPALATAVTS